MKYSAYKYTYIEEVSTFENLQPQLKRVNVENNGGRGAQGQPVFSLGAGRSTGEMTKTRERHQRKKTITYVWDEMEWDGHSLLHAIMREECHAKQPCIRVSIPMVHGFPIAEGYNR